MITFDIEQLTFIVRKVDKHDFLDHNNKDVDANT